MELCSLLIASTLILGTPTGHVSPHSVQYFDVQRNITNRVLNRSVCNDVDRVQAANKTSIEAANGNQVLIEQIKQRAEIAKAKNRRTLSNHCEARFAAETLPNASSECSLERR